MPSIWYVGNADVRTISSADWTVIGAAGSAKKWSKYNGWSLNQTAFTADQITFLDSQDEFAVTSANGPRPGSVVAVSPSDNVTEADVAEAVDSALQARVIEGPLSLLDPRINCALNGTGDQASKIALALSMLPAAGGHIYQPPGILRTGHVAINKPVRWEGAGAMISEIKAASGFTGTLMTIAETPGSAAFCRVHDVALTGGGSAQYGIENKSARTRLSDLYMTGFAAGGAALHFNGTGSSTSSHAIQTRNIWILDCAGYGLFLHGFSYDCMFTDFWIGNCNVGIRAENTNGFFHNTHVWGCVGNGVELRAGKHLISNSYFETNGASGLNLFNAPGCRINNCNVWKNAQQGVVIASSDRCSVSDSLIYDQGQDGVRITDSILCQINDNNFYDDATSSQSQDHPVRFTGTTDYCTVQGNVMRAADHVLAGEPIYVGSNNSISGNIL